MKMNTALEIGYILWNNGIVKKQAESTIHNIHDPMCLSVGV